MLAGATNSVFFSRVWFLQIHLPYRNDTLHDRRGFYSVVVGFSRSIDAADILLSDTNAAPLAPPLSAWVRHSCIVHTYFLLASPHRAFNYAYAWRFHRILHGAKDSCFDSSYYLR